jgi:hypothetical protein
MDLHSVISRLATGEVRVDYVGADRAKATEIYKSVADSGAKVQLFAHMEASMQKTIKQAAPAPKPSKK